MQVAKSLGPDFWPFLAYSWAFQQFSVQLLNVNFAKLGNGFAAQFRLHVGIEHPSVVSYRARSCFASVSFVFNPAVKRLSHQHGRRCRLRFRQRFGWRNAI